MQAISKDPLTENDQRDVRLITLLIGNATLLRNLHVAQINNTPQSVNAEVMGFMTMLFMEFGDGQQLLADITAMAEDIGIVVQRHQCGQVH